MRKTHGGVVLLVTIYFKKLSSQESRKLTCWSGGDKRRIVTVLTVNLIIFIQKKKFTISWKLCLMNYTVTVEKLR